MCERASQSLRWTPHVTDWTLRPLTGATTFPRGALQWRMHTASLNTNSIGAVLRSISCLYKREALV